MKSLSGEGIDARGRAILEAPMPSALRLLFWMADHRAWTTFAAAGYAFLLIFSHERIQKLVRGWYDLFTRARVNTWVHIGMAVLAVLLVRFVWRALMPQRDRGVKLIYLLLTIGLMAGSWRWLLYTDVEVVHFPQFAVLAVLIFPLVRCHWRTVFYTTFIGVVDEAVQFYVYNPWPVHLDFNDMIYNQIGAGLGCMLVWLAGGNTLVRSRPAVRSIGQSLKMPPVWLTLAVGVLCTGLYFAGEMTLDPLPGDVKPRFVVRRQGPSRAYWKDAGLGRQFHDLTVPETIGGFLGLLCLYGSFNVLARRGQSSDSSLPSASSGNSLI